VEDIKEAILTPGIIEEKGFYEKYSKTDKEMAQGYDTGMNYLNLFREKTKNLGSLIVNMI
jgi:hypothetical protein